jgi:hypothetical protein
VAHLTFGPGTRAGLVTKRQMEKLRQNHDVARVSRGSDI